MDFTLMLAIGVFNPKEYSNRILSIRRSLYDEGFVDEVLEDIRHINLWKKWEKYIESPIEKFEAYEDLVNTVKLLFGAEAHERILHNTKFYYRTEYLKKKGLVDTFSWEYQLL